MNKTTKNSVFEYVKKNGLREFPWRKDISFYRVLVSEIMLQQTQAERVIPKYIQFLGTFPTAKHLAKAKKKEVLMCWSGLGYNRRAVLLQNAAKHITECDRLPETEKDIMELPGVGVYTANAILAFVYDTPCVVIETNIRTVVIEHCFPSRENVDDKEIYVVLKDMWSSSEIQKAGARFWYSALMDYGAFLKKNSISHNKKVKGYKKQTPFKGSFRALRSALLQKILNKREGVALRELKKDLSDERCQSALESLVKNNLIVCEKEKYFVR